MSNSHAIIKAPVATKRRTDEPVFSLAVAAALICISMINDAFAVAAAWPVMPLHLAPFGALPRFELGLTLSTISAKQNQIRFFEGAQGRRAQLDRENVPTGAPVGYWAWPFFELRALAADLQAANVTALNEQVDCVRLRRSCAEQIIGAYLRITGRPSQLGFLETAVGGSIVDSWLSKNR